MQKINSLARKYYIWKTSVELLNRTDWENDRERVSSFASFIRQIEVILSQDINDFEERIKKEK